jgi:hypothetical protein
MNTAAQMKKTMQEMLLAEGYHVEIKINKTGYHAISSAMPDKATLTLSYPDSMTPGDVVFAVRNFLNKLNGK